MVTAKERLIVREGERKARRVIGKRDTSVASKICSSWVLQGRDRMATPPRGLSTEGDSETAVAAGPC